MLSIRNTDMSNPINIIATDYYDTKGKLVRRYYQQPMILAPLESTDIFIPEADTAGGGPVPILSSNGIRKKK